jgi:hypothetical protein
LERRARHYVPPSAQLGLSHLTGWYRHAAFRGRCHDAPSDSGQQLKAHQERVEQIFREIQAALALCIVFEIAIPKTRPLDRRVLVGEI